MIPAGATGVWVDGVELGGATRDPADPYGVRDQVAAKVSSALGADWVVHSYPPDQLVAPSVFIAADDPYQEPAAHSTPDRPTVRYNLLAVIVTLRAAMLDSTALLDWARTRISTADRQLRWVQMSAPITQTIGDVDYLVATVSLTTTYTDEEPSP